MRIELSPALRDWIEKQARLQGHGSVDAYVESVLCHVRDQQEHKQIRLDRPELPEVTPAMWEQRRRVLEEEWL